MIQNLLPQRPDPQDPTPAAPWPANPLHLKWIEGPIGPLHLYPELNWNGQCWCDWLAQRLVETTHDWARAGDRTGLLQARQDAGRAIATAGVRLAERAPDPVGAVGVVQLATNAFITLDVLAMALCGIGRPDRHYVLARSLAGLVEIRREDAFFTPLGGFAPRQHYATFSRFRGTVQQHHVANIFRIRKVDVQIRLGEALQRLKSDLREDL